MISLLFPIRVQACVCACVCPRMRPLPDNLLAVFYLILAVCCLLFAFLLDILLLAVIAINLCTSRNSCDIYLVCHQTELPDCPSVRLASVCVMKYCTFYSHSLSTQLIKFSKLCAFVYGIFYRLLPGGKHMFFCPTAEPFPGHV